MKLLLVFFAVLSAVYCVIPEAHHQEWRNFKLAHSKLYDSPEEEGYRFQVFRDNLRTIEEHNRRYDAGLETSILGVNQFADMTDGEFMQETSCLDLPPVFNITENQIYKPEKGVALPAQVDWRDKNAVSPIKNQGGCGSCWAFTTIECLESINYLKTGKMVLLSPQDLVDCAKPWGVNGCHGGYMNRAYQFITDQGIMKESDYLYTAKEGPCKHDSTKIFMKTKGSKFIVGEDDLENAVATIGPVGVGVDAKEWKLYRGGIFAPKEAFNKLTHGVVAVGYGTENGADYWLLRNSYGPNWGEKGFIRIARNKQNAFGVARAAVLPNI